MRARVFPRATAAVDAVLTLGGAGGDRGWTSSFSSTVGAMLLAEMVIYTISVGPLPDGL